jgi:alkaline phosphatase D
MDSYFEIMPIDAEGPNYRLWRSFRWGLTAEFIVLDCRYERRPSMDQYISPQQMMFLKDRMLNSPCHFKVIVNSVPITNMPTIWDVAANDRWEGYPQQRQEVLDFINDNNIENVWFLSGDFHVTFVSRLEPDGMDLASRTREIAITGGNENPLPEFLAGLNQPQFDYGRHRARGCIITFDPMANAVNVRFIDPANGEDVYNKSLTQD